MNSNHINYDQIATEYDQRYPTAAQWERGQALLNLARQIKANSILEVGSGTGFWLNLLSQVTPSVFGVDFSSGMLEQAKKRPAPLKLSRGAAIHMPYRDETFDLLFCVDAIHHFGDQRAFIAEAFCVLKPGGALAVIGHDPHSGEGTWYIYDYFDGVYETDLLRYPSSGSIKNWMKQAGFENIQRQDVEHILNIHMGAGVLNDPFIKHNATSQLALLSKDSYVRGIEKIKADLESARSNDRQIIFKSDFWVKMFTGHKPA